MMTNTEVQDLCMALMRADTEDKVIDLLKNAGFWEESAAWRFFGDYENNYNTIGNQQSRSDAALIEKLVNSVDARLMNECMVRGVDPEGSHAPQSVRDAVAEFFEEPHRAKSETAGRISHWSDAKRTEVARGITLAATGFPPREGRPCFTIADCGEGQTPERMPETLLSLTKSNKLRIPFVQGKFNMGGTGVLKFCGRHHLQLIVSRRNPAIVDRKTSRPSDSDWGFTLVRREDPEGGRRSSVYTYLAPLDSDTRPGQGRVLHFSADLMPIFPDGRNAYAKTSDHGTLIKLYEYTASGYSNTHILRKDGLLARLDLLLPDPALPIRLHECRSAFRGHEGSFETTLTGLRVRLEDGKGENLEDGFPASCPISVDGEGMTATIYAFKKGKADTYRKNEGIIFTVNGQTHGQLTKDFFNRKDAGRLNYIADSILVTVDCSPISGRAREDLFMNSRDRLSHGELRIKIEEQLEEMLRQHQGLRALKEKRRSEEVQSKLEDEKPLEDVLKSLLEHSPTLSNLFLQGLRASNPFKTLKVKEQEKEFHGKKHPTYFKFKDKESGKELQRDCHINQRARIVFETDAANDYFSRADDKGQFTLDIISGEGSNPVLDFVGPNLQNGIATLTVRLPDNCDVGDTLRFKATVNDPTLVQPFNNVFVIDVKEEVETNGGKGGRRKPPSSEKGLDREAPSGIALPNIIPIYEADWPNQNPPFDKYSALRLGISDVSDNGPGNNGHGGNGDRHDVYDFKINMDNLFFKSELKESAGDADLLRARWKYALVLVGLALLHDDAQRQQSAKTSENGEEDSGPNIEARVEEFTKAVAPVLLPMINSLGNLDVEPTMASSSAGEAT
jgi:hypothetical protein